MRLNNEVVLIKGLAHYKMGCDGVSISKKCVWQKES